MPSPFLRVYRFIKRPLSKSLGMIGVGVSADQSGIFHDEFISTNSFGYFCFHSDSFESLFSCVNSVYPRTHRETLAEIRSAQSPTYLSVMLNVSSIHVHTKVTPVYAFSSWASMKSVKLHGTALWFRSRCNDVEASELIHIVRKYKCLQKL